MKILMTLDAVGGVWNYAQELCAALAPMDVEVVLASMGPAPRQVQRAGVQQLPNVKLEISEYRLEWMHDPWRDVDRAGEWLLELADQEDIDLVHLNGYSHANLAWNRPVLVVAHSCVLSWWQAVHGEPVPGEWNIYRDRVRAGLQAAGHVVAPTAALLKHLQKIYGKLPSSSVIHNARSGGEMPPQIPRQPMVLSAGRLWDQAKNMRVLDSAAYGLHWPVFIAGENTGPDVARQCFDHAQLLGPLSSDALAGWMRRASIYAAPALYEPFGLSVLEAALAGCALVLSDIPSFRELWQGAAIFAPPRDSPALHGELVKLIEEPRRRQALAASARQRAMLFTPQRMGKSYFGLYQRLLQPRFTGHSIVRSPFEAHA